MRDNRVANNHVRDLSQSARSHRDRPPTFLGSFRLGVVQGNVVCGVAMDVIALVVDSALLAVLGGLALTFGVAAWDRLGWKWTP